MNQSTPLSLAAAAIEDAKHSPLPWRVEQDTDLIWCAHTPGDSSFEMGWPIVRGRTGRQSSDGHPTWDERAANAALIVEAVNAHAGLVAALLEASARIAKLEAALGCAERGLSETYEALKAGTPIVSIGQWVRLREIRSALPPPASQAGDSQ